jgi:hypothetical protein
VTDGKAYSFGGLGRPKPFPELLVASERFQWGWVNPRAIWSDPMGVSFSNVSGFGITIPRQYANAYQYAAQEQIQAQLGQMAAARVGRLRDLLLPGLQAVAGAYPTIPQHWEAMFAAPRIDGETAARSRERSRGLLKSLLTDAQWAEFESAGRVTERLGGCEFILTPGGMIEASKRRIRERWCVNPDPYADGNDFMPREDLLIGQLLHLRAGPDKLRAQSNVFQA